MNIDAHVDQKKRILLTGGRAPATLDLARQLSANGHEVFMAESCSHHLCVRSKAIVKNYTVPDANKDPDAYITKLSDIIDLENIDWLIPTCEEVFYVARGLQVLSGKCRVFVDSIDKLRRLHSKWDFLSAVKEAGLPHTPPTYLLKTMEDVEHMLDAPGKWVFKRVYSRFSSNVFIVDNDTEKIYPKRMTKEKIFSLLREDIQSASEHSLWIAQQFIQGTSYCSYSTSVNGCVTAQTVYPVEFTAGPGACISFRSVRHPAIFKWIHEFVKAENFTGQIAFDFIVTDEGEIYPIECNPRATSGVHLFTPEDRLDKALLAETVQEISEPITGKTAMIATAMLSYGSLQIRSWSLAKRWLRLLIGSKDVLFRIKDPFPFFQQFPLLWWNIKVSRKKKISIMEATTIDIEWNGEEQ